MKAIFNFIIFLMCFIMPATMYGEALPQPNEDTPVVSQRHAKATQSTRPSDNHNSYNEEHHNSHNVNLSPHNSYHPQYNHNGRHAISPPQRHYNHTHGGPHVITTHYYRPRTHYVPTYRVEPIVYDNSCTSCSVNESYDNYESSGKFGLGLIGILYKYHEYGNINDGLAGGLGYYIKYRPIRYFSLEFTNQYLYGNLKYSRGWEQEYIKIPFTLGARFHFFDYGNLDVYSAIAGSISVWRYIEDYDYWREQYNYLHESGVQYGGQIGMGVSFIVSSLEFGVDLRYTIESVPNYIPGYYSDKDDNEVVHGMLLSAAIGFSL